MAATTIGKYSGLQPAMTALVAAFSTVHSIFVAEIEMSTSSGLRRTVPMNCETTSGRGGTIGKPSVQPRSKYASIAAKASTLSTVLLGTTDIHLDQRQWPGVV